jgi:hypothetical protein
MSVSLLILEGPPCDKIRGWRHYQFVSRNKSSTCIGLPDRVQESIDGGNVAFCAAGTWEDETKPVAAGAMPVPRADILAIIHPKNNWQDQLQFA